MSAATATATTEEERDEKKKKPRREPAREAVETIVFVVVLVLLLKLFVTEAFVIPTGSMAETLFGYQKLITCPKCGHEFPVNSHDEVEVNPQTGQKHKLIGYCCPNCRHQGRVEDLNPQPQNRTGDRVLVLKPLYHITRPERGDVVVFKYPEEPQQKHTAQNYIKRAMGFGGETVAIHRGELFVTTSLTYPESDPLFPRPENLLDLWKPQYMYANSKHAEELFEASRATGFASGKGGFEIVRKGEKQVLEDRRLVWDNDKQPKELAGRVPPRWYAPQPGADKWRGDVQQERDFPRAFAHNGDTIDWIRYRHLVYLPDPTTGKLLRDPRTGGFAEWRWPEAKIAPIAGPVDNMLGYNAGIDWNPVANREQSRDTGLESLWVGDLILECEVELVAGSEVVLELSKGVNRFQARFGNGHVMLVRDGAREKEFGNPSRPCKVTTGTYKLRFANVDARLMVWVDDKRIDFGTEGDYTPAENSQFEPEDAQAKEGWTRANDIEAPARVGAKGQVTIRGLKLFRDIYYTRSSSDHSGADIFYVQPGHYMCLGDNSAQSSDSRKWGVVPERLMLGKAVFVFFPVGRVGFIK